MSWGNIEDFTGFDNIEPSKASVTQVSIIEGLLITAAIPEKEKEIIGREVERFSEQEAYDTIQYLKDNEIHNDPAKQWVKFIKR